jgi:hypothetical protein
MARKMNTLSDLTSFLEAEKTTLSESNPILKIEKAQDFFSKEPVKLFQIELDEEKNASINTQSESTKFIDSPALRKTSLEEVNELIKTLALENKMSVQQVITTLYMRSILPDSVTNIVDITANMQKSYALLMADFQKNWWKR